MRIRELAHVDPCASQRLERRVILDALHNCVEELLHGRVERGHARDFMDGGLRAENKAYPDQTCRSLIGGDSSREILTPNTYL